MSLSFSKKWPTLYGDFVVHGPPPYKNCPPQQFLATSTAFWIFTPQTGSVSLCRDEDNSSPHLPCQADPLSGSDGCCLVPLLSPGGGFTHRSGVIRDPATPDPPHDLLPAQCLGSPRGPLGARPGRYGGALAELLPGASAAVTEARGLSAPGTVGVRGSMAAGHTRNPDSWREPPRGDPPFAGVVHGVWTLHPRATCRSLPAPSRAPGRIPCVRTGAGGVQRGQSDGFSVPPGTPGVPP
ncbi:hypothetical protein N7530_012838 [Penicillium desertorum]|uniref:Uncharacterized protein n=1 Tax=Penicillium desertorum TaxID=1303715 RepID=A0A9W9WDA9_9EURO|nr:hypothetical protein N7530_012838 [Penicillium desertorum]